MNAAQVTQDSGAHAHGGGASAAQVASQASAGVAALGTAAPAGHAGHAGHDGLSYDRRINGQIADPAKSQGVMDRLRALIAKYPTVAAVKAAGAPQDKPNQNHWTLPNKDGLSVIDEGTTQFAHLLSDNKGNIVGAQINSKTTGEPPAWGGVWGRHEAGKWAMTHVYIDRPFNEAFTH